MPRSTIAQLPTGRQPLSHRSLVGFRWRDQCVVATRHDFDGSARVAERTVLLLLNAGPAPRAGNSDLSVKLADASACAGIPAVRIDVPGVGDSTGASVRRLEEFRVAAQEGPLDDCIAHVARTLLESERSQRIVLGGLCAGSVLAIRASARLRERCGGLLLLEPDLMRAAPSTRDSARDTRMRRFVRRAARALERRRWGRWIGTPAMRILERDDPQGLPSGVHAGLVAELVAATARSTPALVVAARGLECERVVSAIVRRFPAAGSHISLEVVSGTNHILTAGDAASRVVPCLANWLRVTVPGNRPLELSECFLNKPGCTQDTSGAVVDGFGHEVAFGRSRA